MGRTDILGISGFSGAGKTTLIEQLLLEFKKKDINIAVIKQHHEPIQNDLPGKDTFRFYQAGASVLSYDGQSIFFKSRRKEPFSPDHALEFLGNSYDLILAEGFKSYDFQKIWLLCPDETKPPQSVTNIIKVLPWDADRLNSALLVLQQWLSKHHPQIIHKF